MPRFNKNNKFLKHPELIEALRYGTMSQTEIAKKLGVSTAYVTKFKKKLLELDELPTDPFQKKLVKQNKSYLKFLAEKVDLSIDDFRDSLNALIQQTMFIVEEIRSSDTETWQPSWINVKLNAIKTLVQLWQTKVEQFEKIETVKGSAEIELLKRKVHATIDFLQEHAPELVAEYIAFLDSYDPSELSDHFGQKQKSEGS